MEENAQEQHSKQIRGIIPYRFKKGVSGNPGGRPKGAKSMKTYAKEYLEAMPDEDRVEFLNGLDPKVIWEMSEGKPKQDLEVSGELTSKIVSVDE